MRTDILAAFLVGGLVQLLLVIAVPVAVGLYYSETLGRPVPDPPPRWNFPKPAGPFANLIPDASFDDLDALRADIETDQKIAMRTNAKRTLNLLVEKMRKANEYVKMYDHNYFDGNSAKHRAELTELIEEINAKATGKTKLSHSYDDTTHEVALRFDEK
jgi:hypothetical protein